jgi:predicted transcriptional regulator
MFVGQSNSIKQCCISWGAFKTRKRNEINVVAKILRVAAKGSKEDEIMDKCKLDSTALDNYLSALAELNLLTMEDKEDICFRTTEKGLQFLKTYHKLRWLLLGKDNDFLLMRILGQIRRKENPPFYVS